MNDLGGSNGRRPRAPCDTQVFKVDRSEKPDRPLLNTRLASEHIAPTHKVDCYKNRVALEVEWNNKDPFFDRDLYNFRLLFDLRAIDAGAIITRCSELQRIFNQLGRGPSFGNSTTHMAKLSPRLDGGSGGGCPVVVFGIRAAAYVED